MTASGPDAKVLRTATGIAFWIHVHPRARTTAVGGLRGDALRVSVREPAVEGRANEACARALAEALRVPRSAVGLDPAARGRRKRVQVEGPAEALEARVRELAAGG